RGDPLDIPLDTALSIPLAGSKDRGCDRQPDDRANQKGANEVDPPRLDHRAAIRRLNSGAQGHQIRTPAVSDATRRHTLVNRTFTSASQNGDFRPVTGGGDTDGHAR